MRKLIGRIIEYFLSYEHKVIFEGIKPVGFYSGDAGVDLIVSEDIIIHANEVMNIPTELRIDPKDRIWFEIKARSSTFKNKHLEVQDAVIDRGYRGDLFAVTYNPNKYPVKIHKDDRICQIVPHRLIPTVFYQGKLSNSDRSNKGFGSSGK